MEKRDLEEFEANPLSKDDIRYLRMMIDRDKRMRWLWGTIYRFGIALGAVAAAITAITTFIKKV